MGQSTAGRHHHRHGCADPQPHARGQGLDGAIPRNAPVGSFNITQLGDPADKIGKDTNFRGLTVFNNVLYYTKGSGSNGVNTVYFVDPTGTVGTNTNGVGRPPAGAALPTSGRACNPKPTVIQAQGLVPNNMCILNGFPTALKSKTSFPFGICKRPHAVRRG